MRPCQHCGGPIGNGVSVCPACGHQDIATIRSSSPAPAANNAPLPAQRSEQFERRLTWTIVCGYWLLVFLSVVGIWASDWSHDWKIWASVFTGIGSVAFFGSWYLPTLG